MSKYRLEEYGWRPPPKDQREWLGQRNPSLWIDHKDRILVSYTARESAALASREHPGLGFHILRLAPEGKVELSLSLPAISYLNGIYLGARDQLIARASDFLQILPDNTSSGKSISDWQLLTPCPKDCIISYSFTRRTLVLAIPKKPFDHEHQTYTIVDTSGAPSRVVENCSQMAFYARKISDKFAYWNGSEGHEPFTRRFPFCDLDHAEELPLGWMGALYVLNDNTFLTLGIDYKNSRGNVGLVGADGGPRFRQELPKNQVPLYFAGPGVTSDELGRRFAFVLGTFRGGARSFDASGKLVARRIVVYSETGKELVSVSVSTTFHPEFDFSLSPDGHLLAVLDNGILTLIHLD
jgi:hypothetical protein